MFQIWDFDYWYLKWIHQEKQFNGFSKTKSQIKPHLLYLISTTTNFLHVYYVNIASYETLEKNNDIIITKPDKGNGVAILDWKLYDKAIQEIIWNTWKHKNFSKWKHNFFNKNEYDRLYPSGSAPARIYGTPEMHKFSSSDSYPKLYPIVSSIGSFNYNTARFLCDLLSPLVSNDYSCKDTFSFVSQVKNVNLSKKCLVSHHATSLITNIPPQETIDIAINLIFNHNPNLSITKKELKIFSFCYITD